MSYLTTKDTESQIETHAEDIRKDSLPDYLDLVEKVNGKKLDNESKVSEIRAALCRMLRNENSVLQHFSPKLGLVIIPLEPGEINEGIAMSLEFILQKENYPARVQFYPARNLYEIRIGITS